MIPVSCNPQRQEGEAKAQRTGVGRDVQGVRYWPTSTSGPLRAHLVAMGYRTDEIVWAPILRLPWLTDANGKPL